MADVSSAASLKAILRFPFQGAEWQKRFLIGSLLMLSNMLVPILPMIVLGGYLLQIMRMTIRGEAPDLPAFDDWEAYIRDGFKGFLVYLVYLLPGMLLMLIGFLAYFVSVFGLSLSSMDQTTTAIGVFGLWVAMAVMLISMVLAGLFMMLGAIPIPIGTARLLSEDRVGAAFELRSLLSNLRANRWGYLLAWVIALGLMGLFYLVFWLMYASVILCCLLPFVSAPISFYMGSVLTALFGMTYHESTRLMAAHATEAPAS